MNPQEIIDSICSWGDEEEEEKQKLRTIRQVVGWSFPALCSSG